MKVFYDSSDIVLKVYQVKFYLTVCRFAVALLAGLNVLGSPPLHCRELYLFPLSPSP